MCCVEQAELPTRHRRGRLARCADRRRDLLADMGERRARGASGQRDPPRRAILDQARKDLRVRREDGAGAQRRQARLGTDPVLPPLPDRAAVRARRRLLDPNEESDRARGVLQRLPDRVERESRHSLPRDARSAEGLDDQREQPDSFDPPRRAGARVATVTG